MWKLIKADLCYNRVIYIVIIAFIFFFAFANSILGGMEEIIAFVILGMLWLGASATGMLEQKAKKIRFIAALPLSLKQLAIYKNTLFLLPWVGMFFLLFLSSLISQHGRLSLDYLCWMLTKVGSIILFVSCGNLSKDAYFCLKDRKWGRSITTWIISPLLYAFGIAALIGLYSFTVPGPAIFRGWLLPTLSETLLSFPGAFGVFLFSLALLASGIYVYTRRRSYAEDLAFPRYWII